MHSLDEIYALQQSIAASPPGAFSKSSPFNNTTDVSIATSLSWGSSTGATAYLLCIETGDIGVCNEPGDYVNVGKATSYKPGGGLAPGATYSWQVQAINDQGATAANDGKVWKFTTLPRPGAFSKDFPVNRFPYAYAEDKLSWNPADQATGYEYCLNEFIGDNCGSAWIDVGNNLEADVSGLNAGTTYSWQIRARNASGHTEADEGTWWTFTTYNAPGSFSKTGPDNGAEGLYAADIPFSWEESNGVGYYLLCFDTINNDQCDGEWRETVNTFYYDDVPEGQTYFWQVTSNNFSFETEADSGQWWSFSTLAPPGEFSKSLPTNGATNVVPGARLSWETSDHAAHYLVCVDIIDDNECDGQFVDVGNVTNVDAVRQEIGLDLLPGFTFYWQVIAVNDLGAFWGNDDQWWSFTVTEPENDVFADGFETLD